MPVAALEQSDKVADRDHAFAVLKRGYPRRKVILQKVKCVHCGYSEFCNAKPKPQNPKPSSPCPTAGLRDLCTTNCLFRVPFLTRPYGPAERVRFFSLSLLIPRNPSYQRRRA